MDAMTPVSAWDALVHQLLHCFSQRTARTWHHIVSGWVLNRGPATVTNIIRTLGDVADRRWTVYQKFSCQGSWRLDPMSGQLPQRVIGPLIVEQGSVDPAVGEKDSVGLVRCGLGDLAHPRELCDDDGMNTVGGISFVCQVSRYRKHFIRLLF